MKYVEVVAAVVVCSKCVLVTQRASGPWRGKWEFPGGKVEPGESLQAALRREIREELRMDVFVDRFLRTENLDALPWLPADVFLLEDVKACLRESAQ